MRPQPTSGESDDTFQATHQTVRDQLLEYVTLIANNHTPEGDFRALEDHLAMCDECRAERDELLELVVATYNGQIEPAPTYPAANLGFLRQSTLPSPQTQRLSQMDNLGRWIVQFSQSVLDAITPPQLVGALRGARLYEFAEPADAPHRLGIKIEIDEDEVGQEQASLSIIVDDPAHGPFHQAGTEIRLRAGDDEWVARTDDVGSAEFSNIPRHALSQLQMVITPRRDGA